MSKFIELTFQENHGGFRNDEKTFINANLIETLGDYFLTTSHLRYSVKETASEIMAKIREGELDKKVPIKEGDNGFLCGWLGMNLTRQRLHLRKQGRR